MDWDKLINHAGSVVIAIALIYFLAQVTRENRDALVTLTGVISAMQHQLDAKCLRECK
jgi:hypothetical protein